MKRSRVAVAGAVVRTMGKKFGSDSAIHLKDQRYLAAVSGGVSTQCLSLNLALGRPGIPLGRITEISGLESHGKSTLATHILAQAQRQGGIAILIDSESGYDQERAARLGVKEDELVILQPESMEAVFDMIRAACESIPADVSPVVVVWDSVAGTPALAEVEGKFDDKFVGIHARILGQGFRKIVRFLAERQIALVLVNQLRDNIVKFGHGEQYKTFGGHALLHHATVRIRVKRIQTEKKKNRPVGIWCQAHIHKNKVAAPGRVATFYLDFEKGIDRVRDLIDCGVESGLFQPSGKDAVSYKGKSYKIANASTELFPKLGGSKGVQKRLYKEAIADGVFRLWSK